MSTSSQTKYICSEIYSTVRRNKILTFSSTKSNLRDDMKHMSCKLLTAHKTCASFLSWSDSILRLEQMRIALPTAMQMHSIGESTAQKQQLILLWSLASTRCWCFQQQELHLLAKTSYCEYRLHSAQHTNIQVPEI